jgi:hypothetical protein
MAGQQQSPLQEGDRRFESGSLVLTHRAKGRQRA